MKQVERQIFDLEGFKVRFQRRSPTTGELRDVRSDLKRVPPYVYSNRAANHLTVTGWTDVRANPTFFEVLKVVPIVLYYDGSQAPGHTLLSTVRSSYPKKRGK